MAVTVATSMHRVQQQTEPEVNQRICRQTHANIAYYAEHPELIDRRLRELDREWDVERWLELNSAALSLAGIALSILRGRKWLILPLAVQGFFLQHGLQGWCPPLPLLRRAGVRTQAEIEAERHALKALRGDFGPQAQGEAALLAAER